MYAQMKDDAGLHPLNSQSHIRDYLSWGPWSLFTPGKIKRYAEDVLAKSRDGQPVSFTDIYGHIVGTHLMGDVRTLCKLVCSLG